MKFTLSWLKKYIETTATLDEILDQLTEIGIEVEHVEDRAKTFEGFVVGKVIECNKHPDADRLNVTMVDTGSEKIQVVCGAPNCTLGLKGIFAPSGSYVPGLDVTLKKTNIRGIESNGMLCSEKELCLSEEHNGIISLPEDTELGGSAALVLGLDDPIIEIEVTPNRGDWSGVYGIARDLAATGIGTLKTLDIPVIEGSFKSSISIEIMDDTKKACPLFVGRHIKNVKNGQSPKWLKDQLSAIGLRPISALVDITNYFCMGLNRPLHVFDAQKLSGNLSVRLSKQGEKIEALNDKSYDLKDGMTAIADDNGVQALGGVVGAVSTGCTEDTTEIFLESAWFDPVCTARTGRSLQLNTDARYRFERAVDPLFTRDGAELATQMILELCGGDVSELVISGTAPDLTRVIDFKTEKTKHLGGCDISDQEQQGILETLGCVVENGSDVWKVTTPSWRPDIEGSADLVEEILRIYGFDKIEPVFMPRAETYQTSPLTTLQKNIGKARRGLAARGLCESVTWAFMSSDKADLFGVNDDDKKASLTLSNPISSEWDVMRPSILPNLMDASVRNAARGYGDVGLFEVGGVYHNANHDGQKTVATVLRAGSTAPRHWSGENRSVDVFDAKADAFALLESCGVNAQALQISSGDAPSWFHPGRSGALRQGKVVLAYFGEFHPTVLDEMDIKHPLSGCEVFLENIPKPRSKGAARKSLKMANLQPVYRDFAFVVDEDVTADKILRAVRAADKKMIVDAHIFDVYQGKGIEEGQKSLAVQITLQPVTATLTDQDLEKITASVVKLVLDKTGGVLRG